jgi:hypothetical protein
MMLSAVIRRFLAVEAGAFFLAALIHAGYLVQGYQHHAARIAECILGLVLAAGLVTGVLRPALTRAAGILTQGFALLGTLVGVFTIMVGVGPRSLPDVIYHLAMVGLLLWGLRTAVRAPASER